MSLEVVGNKRKHDIRDIDLRTLFDAILIYDRDLAIIVVS